MKIEDVPFGSVIEVAGKEFFLYNSDAISVQLISKQGHYTSKPFDTEVIIKYRPDLVKLKDAINGKHYTLKGLRVVVREYPDCGKIAVILSNGVLLFNPELILEMIP